MSTFKDFGTMGGQCTTQVGLNSGVAKPSKKPGTKDICIVDAMLALLEYTKNAQVQVITQGSATVQFKCA